MKNLNCFRMLLLLLWTLPAVVQAQFNYTTNNGTITITGYTGPGGAVVIPDTINGRPVTRIGDNAFYNKTSLTSITIPNSVTNIGNGAFFYCTGLSAITVDAFNPIYSSVDGVVFNKSQTVLILFPAGKAGSYTIPNSVTNIGNGAFYVCTSLTSLTIPNSVTSIGNFAFAYCTSLTSVTIGNSVTTIGDYAFAGCTGLASVTIPDSVTSICYRAFDYCTGLTSVTVGNGVTSIGDYAFAHCTSLANVTIGNSVTYIGGFAFESCTSLTSVTIPGSVTAFGREAFYNCTGLTSVTIANGVRSLGYAMFYGCTNLTSVTIPNSVTNIEGYAFYYCTSLTNVTIGNSVTYIGVSAFSFCRSLISVMIGNGVTNIGDYAFWSCTSLAAVYFQGNAPSIDSADPGLGPRVFEGAYNVTVYYLPGATGWRATFAGRPAVLWNPLVQTGDASFGVRTNRFGFTITGASNLVLVVEAATNLAHPAWVPVGTNTLTGGASYFSDPEWTNHPARFYRLRSP
jgi:hypothetical protein